MLDIIVDELQRRATKRETQGILATKTGQGRSTAELCEDVAAREIVMSSL